jgi:hypothetical protein
VKINNDIKYFSRVVLSARALIKPLVVFKKTAGDNRVYGDNSIDNLILISIKDKSICAGN